MLKKIFNRCCVGIVKFLGWGMLFCWMRIFLVLKKDGNWSSLERRLKIVVWKFDCLSRNWIRFKKSWKKFVVN